MVEVHKSFPIDRLPIPCTCSCYCSCSRREVHLVTHPISNPSTFIASNWPNKLKSELRLKWFVELHGQINYDFFIYVFLALSFSFIIIFFFCKLPSTKLCFAYYLNILSEGAMWHNLAQVLARLFFFFGQTMRRTSHKNFKDVYQFQCSGSAVLLWRTKQ